MKNIRRYVNRISISGLFVLVTIALTHLLEFAGHVDLLWTYKKELFEYGDLVMAWSGEHIILIQFIFIGLGLLLIGYGPYLTQKLSTYSPFKIEFRPQDPSFSFSSPNPYFTEQVKRIRITNASKTRPIGNVKVTMNNLDPQLNLLYASPVPLRFTNDQKPPFDQFRVLNEGESVFVDVVSLKHSSELPPGTSQLHVEHAKTPESQMITNDSYNFKIIVSGDGAHEKSSHFNVRMKNQCIVMTTIEEKSVLSASWAEFCGYLGWLKRKLPLTSNSKAKLWDLRTQGVSLRNENVDHWSYPEWKERFESWHSELLLEAQKISTGLGSYLETLDQCTQPDLVSPANREHEQDLRVLSEVLFRLQKFLEGHDLNL